MDDVVTALQPESVEPRSGSSSSDRSATIHAPTLSSRRSSSPSHPDAAPPPSDVARISDSTSEPGPSSSLHAQSGPGMPPSSVVLTRSAPLPSARPRWPLAMVALAAGVLGTVAMIRLSPLPDRRAPEPATAATAAPATPPTFIGGAALPPAKPEAIAAFQAGVKAFRDDSLEVAIAELDRAAALDPALAPAAGLRVVTMRAIDTIDAPLRERFREVDRRRDELSERDRMLLDAFEPLVRRQPSDFREATLRLTAAVERFPDDAELWFDLAACGTMGIEAGGSSFAGAIPILQKALEIDPAFIPALTILGEYQAYQGAFDEAHRVLDRCLKVSPAAALCMRELSEIYQQEGQCDRMEATARRLIAAVPGDEMGYATLARSLAGRRPIPSVLEALKQKWSAGARQGGGTPDGGSPAELSDRTRLAMLDGDFESAERHARALDRAVAASPSQQDHGYPARWLAQIFLETGRAHDAGQVAESFLSRRDAWEPDPRAEDYAMATDATPALLRVLLSEGRLSRPDIESRRADWVKAWESRVIPASRRFIWLHGYAEIVDDAATAKEALSALRTYAPIPPYRPRTLSAEGIGLMHFLTGDNIEALRWLNEATRACMALDFPLEHTRAHYWLGRVREEVKDPSACDAYAVVVRRWGEARPPSVTARKAQARMKALGCTK
ncbi:MAG: tetratricopeptide repeat protein [Minicystis sp.]